MWEIIINCVAGSSWYCLQCFGCHLFCLLVIYIYLAFSSDHFASGQRCFRSMVLQIYYCFFGKFFFSGCLFRIFLSSFKKFLFQHAFWFYLFEYLWPACSEFTHLSSQFMRISNDTVSEFCPSHNWDNSVIACMDKFPRIRNHWARR